VRRFCFLLCLAACDDAVVLEVHTAPGAPAEEVQLFIGLGSCGDCPGIQPPSIPEILPGEVYYRDDSYRAARPRIAKVENGVARFRIEASEVGDAFTLAVAVDSNNRSAAVIQSLPLDEAGKYRVDLRETTGGLGPKVAANGEFVGIWTQPGGTFTCMGFEHWTNGRLDGRLFIVPADDLDCDARVNEECAPYGFDSTGLPTFEEASCTTKEVLPVDGSICWLGGPACDEKTGTEHACYPTDYCLPSAFCDPLTNAACGSFDGAVEACLFSDAQPAARFKCTIAFEPSSDNTHADQCGSNSFEVDLFPSAGTNSPITCVAPPDSSRLLYERPMMGEPREFSHSVQWTTKDAAGRMFPLDMKLYYTYAGCKFKVETSGDKALGAAVPLDKKVYAQFWTSKNGGRARKLLVPVELSFVDDCNRPSSCVLVMDDSTTNCLR
jgi:hypothetical protein